MFKDFTYDERFSMFAKFIDAIDPERSRHHLLFPLVARCSTLFERQRILYQFIHNGYGDISTIPPFLMVKYFFQPMLGKIIFIQSQFEI